VTRRARVFLPLLLGVSALAFYWFLDRNRSLIPGTHFDPAVVLHVLLFAAWVPLIFFAVRVVDLIAFDVFATRRGTVRAPLLLREIVSIALYVLAFASAFSWIFNRSIAGFLTTGTVVAAVLGLALQETLGNLFAGIALHLEDSFSPGDVIRSGDFIGIVESVRWRGTRLRTFNNNLVILPNSVLARERLEVFPRSNFNARVLQIGVDYNVPPATVIAILTQAATNVDGVVREMPCIARIGGFAESSVTYEVKYFTTDYSTRDRIDSDIRKAAWYALRRNGIPIPYPIRSVHPYDPPQQRHHPDPEEILDRLSGIDILSPLTGEERKTIADAARVHVYAKGETIIRHGAAGESMFVVHQGSVSVRVESKEVARLEPGDFFGEMALLTGERRAADVIAVTDVVAVEIAKHALQPVLLDHPDLAASISARVIERRSRLDSQRAEEPEEQGSVLSRIRAYFGL